jgi:carbon monoxide dehydrogenase subunit G
MSVDPNLMHHEKDVPRDLSAQDQKRNEERAKVRVAVSSVHNKVGTLRTVVQGSDSLSPQERATIDQKLRTMQGNAAKSTT